MQNSTNNTDFVNEKLPVIKRMTISVKKTSDETSGALTGPTLNEVLRELARHFQENEFGTKRSSDGNLNWNENSVFNSSPLVGVGSVKFISTLPSELNKNDCATSKVWSQDGFGKHQKHSTFLIHPPVVNKPPHSTVKQNQIMICNNKEGKTEFECASKIGEICQDPVEIKKYECSQSTRKNEFSNVIQESVDTVENESDKSDSSVCVIEEVCGNAVTTFSSNDDDITFYDDEDVIYLDSKESQLIVPKKTDDITKIKGWRRKQFFVEKPTTVEFQALSYDNTICNKISVEQDSSEATVTSPDNHVKNAFVCDSLDEFLEQEAELKINYEIPHLFAEVGIKLTKEEIVSAPILSEKDMKEVETKYCRQIPSQKDDCLNDLKTEKIKKGKRPIDNCDEESFKVVKLENNNMRLVRRIKKSTDKKTQCYNKYTPNTKQESKEKNLNEMDLDIRAKASKIKLTSKVLGLVVYPSPHKPLHPIVQFHLRKLRSYHTAVDANWANFAASAVVRKDSKYKRCILPTICCVKVITDPIISKDDIKSINSTVLAADETETAPSTVKEANNIGKPADDQCLRPRLSDTKIPSVEELKRIKNCRVVIKKIDIGPNNKSLCINHKRSNCKCCDGENPKLMLKPFYAKKTNENLINRQTEFDKPVFTSSQPDFYENIADLSAKKLKLLHPNIDSLKTLNINSVELIKLKFIQKSFLHKYISIWFLKPQKADMKCRAFLTFSKTSPVPNAINLRSNSQVNNLPKGIREIVCNNKCIDPNEYVLLYCNGDYWEIQGTVNVTLNKSIKSKEKVLFTAESLELKNLRDVSFKMLKVKAVKWWILDLTQQFKIIELKLENLVARVSQKKIFKFIKHYNAGFMPLLTSLKGRVFGTYVIEGLLPYVLVGPYHVFETRNMNLKGDFSTVRFVYNEVEDLKKSSLLKCRISSIIKETKETGKTVEGLWLHHTTLAVHSCFLEIRTAFIENTSSRNNYSIHNEHGYSLSSTSLPNLVRKSQSDTLKDEVYLYFDIFSLGYVLGVMEKDNSITIRHPLNERTKVNSAEIGKWFLGIVRRRIRCIPKNLVVNWHITKNKSNLKNRQPFNKNFLNGAHILTESGVFYVLKVNDSLRRRGIVKKRNIVEAAANSSVVEEALYLKLLSDTLVRKSKYKPSVDKVLKMAVNEIRKLQKKLDLLERLKTYLEEEKLKLFNSYLVKIHLKNLNQKLSMVLLKQMEKLFLNKNGKVCEAYMNKLELYSFGRQYLKALNKQEPVKFNAAACADDVGE